MFMNALFCKHIYIVIKNKREFNSIEKFLHLWDSEPIRSIELLIDFYVENYVLNNLCVKFPRLFRVVCASSKGSNSISKNGKSIKHTQRSLQYLMNENHVSKNNFVISMDLYQESQYFNTYFNKKVFINCKGEISNHLLSKKIIGNILNEDISVLISKIKDDNFTRFWKVKKDLIEICCDCEHRYMCIDRREPLYDSKKNKWYHETKCGYNPYTAEWEEWSTNPLKQSH